MTSNTLEEKIADLTRYMKRAPHEPYWATAIVEAKIAHGAPLTAEEEQVKAKIAEYNRINGEIDAICKQMKALAKIKGGWKGAEYKALREQLAAMDKALVAVGKPLGLVSGV